MLVEQYTAPSDFGVVWPTTKGGKKVSTTVVGKKVWCAAAGEGPLADAIAKESNWRWNYPAHLVKLAEEASTSPAAALEIAQRGLDALHGSLQYIHPDGSRVPLSSVSERDASPVVSLLYRHHHHNNILFRIGTIHTHPPPSSPHDLHLYPHLPPPPCTRHCMRIHLGWCDPDILCSAGRADVTARRPGHAL